MALFVVAAQVQGFAAGDGKCGCLGVAHEEGSAAILAGYPAYFGGYCQAWDEHYTEVCDHSDAADYCASRWCYVDEHCPTATASIYFVGSGLYYSYEDCGAGDTFTSKCAPPMNEVKSAILALGIEKVPVKCNSEKHGGEGRALHGLSERDTNNDGLHSFDGTSEIHMDEDRRSFEKRDVNGDGIINAVDREIIFGMWDSDDNGCLDTCEYFNGQSRQKGCPLLEEYKLAYAIQLTAQTNPMERAVDFDACIPKADFIDAINNMYWKCHQTLEDFINPRHTGAFPFCDRNDHIGGPH